MAFGRDVRSAHFVERRWSLEGLKIRFSLDAARSGDASHDRWS
jgi:hypothetical protein